METIVTLIPLIIIFFIVIPTIISTNDENKKDKS